MATKTLPVGFDRADGTTTLPAQANGLQAGLQGSYSPPSAILQEGLIATLYGMEEFTDSPEIELAEQATAQHRLHGTWASGLQYIFLLYRGAFLIDSGGNTWRILSSKIQASEGNTCIVTYTSESISFDTPPDEYSCVPVDLGIDILKHPRYSWALLPYSTDSSTYSTMSYTGSPSGTIYLNYNDIKQAVVKMIQTYRDTPYLPSGDTLNGYVQSSILTTLKGANGPVSGVTTSFANPNFSTSTAEVAPNGTNNLWTGAGTNLPTANCRTFVVNVPIPSNSSHPVNIAIAAAYEIIGKLWRGEDTPPVTAYEITWSQFSYAPLFLNPGNYIENPIGIVPDYFSSPAQNGSNTIFDQLTLINPQCFASNGQYSGPLGISSLRCPDETDFERTWFKTTHKWRVSFVGHWDSDLDTNNPRPQLSTDFHTLL